MIRLPNVSTILPYTTLFRSELAEALCDELRRLDVDAETVTGGFPPPEPGRAYALIPPHEYFVLEGHHSPPRDRKSTRLNSSHMSISYAVFCLKKKNNLPSYT